MTTAREVFVVVGSTGEYSDERRWMVAAYPTEALAQAHAEAAKRWYQENTVLQPWPHSSAGGYPKLRAGTGSNPFDAQMDIEYTGTFWKVERVEMRETLPAAHD